MIKGKLYGVGVGPGSADLLTLRAVKIIGRTKCLAVPKTKGEKNAALDIVKGIVNTDGKEILYMDFPMTADKAVLDGSYREKAVMIESILDKGEDVCFITLGDVSIYSTFSYIEPLIREKGFETEICPGVPSFCAVGASLNTSLTVKNEPLHIIPAAYGGIERLMGLNGTKVFMNAGKHVEEIFKCAEANGFKAMGIENCTMGNERKVFENAESFGYFTTIVVKGE